ncbi:hypothetical protein FSOLCH5_015393 [Fusarium solani]
MVNQQRPSGRDDFDIAFVCALKREFDAVSLIFDEFWDDGGDQYGRGHGDHNHYVTGRIGKFNVVATLLGIGKINSASATASLRSSYPNVKLALLVGICGGVPSVGGQQVRFGDVIIGTTVVQHDFGTQMQDEFIRKDTPEADLSPAPKDIRNLLATFETDLGRDRLRDRSASFLAQLQRNASLKKREEKYRSPDVAASQALTMTEYQPNRTIEIPAPAIFLGHVASGDTVMRSQKHRDELVKEHGVISFEMEGAGAWQELPCVIVKGVCDFSDEGKTKDWQDYAAATAASTSKAILERYIRTDKPPGRSTTASDLLTTAMAGDTYTGKVEGKKGVSQGTEMEITTSSSQPPRNFRQDGSHFGADVKAVGDIRQGNKMKFS